MFDRIALTTYEALADKYEKEYEFEKSLKMHEKIINHDPYCPINYRKKVRILIKQNKIDDALLFLNNIKSSKYYCKNEQYFPHDWFMKTIDELIIDCEEKKKKGYVYKPRKRSK